MAISPKQQQIAVVGLLLAFAFLLLKQLSTLGFVGGKKTQVPTPVAAAQPFHPTIPEMVKGLRQHEESLPNTLAGSGASITFPTFTYTAESTRDPFLSLLPIDPEQQSKAMARGQHLAKPARVIKPPELLVRGVIWGGQRPQAFIDDAVYDIGATVKGAKIVAIGRDGVTVSVEGLTFELGITTATARRVPGRPGYRPPVPRQMPAHM